MADIFDILPGQDSAKRDIFDSFPAQQESTGKSLLRTGLQIPQGIAEGTAPGLAAGLFQLLAMGESDLSPEEFHKLRQLAEEQGGQFDDESYEQARQQMLGMIPTVSNIGREVEEQTGVPLEPKTRLQKGLRFGANVAKALPKTGGEVAPFGTGIRGTNTALPRPVTALGAEVAREGLIEAGLPESAADLVSLATIKRMGPGSSSLSVDTKKKPSGLTERRFEKTEEPTTISGSRKEKINEKVESEFREISDDILAKSPIGETYSNLKNDASFKQAAREGLKKAEEVAAQIPETVHTKDVTKNLADRMRKKEGSGFLASEYEKEHNGFVKQFIEETKDKDLSAVDLVVQYRKNNRGFSEINEPGKSYAYNQAKRDALREYNLAIADVIKEKYPNSEFAKIFEDTNREWSRIMDAEVMGNFIDDMFDGKIDFKKGRDFFEKNGYQVPFKRGLGEKGYNDFKTLLNDLMSTEKAHSMLKVAKQKGFSELAEMGLGYVIHPTLGKARIAYGLTKGAIKGAYQMLLDKPQLAVKWDKGVKAFKKGDFKTAETEFKALEKERERVEALGKFNEKLKKPSETESVK